MFKKFLALIAWIIGVTILAVGCWLLGISQQRPLWQSAALFVAIIIGLWTLSWLYRRFKAWRLRQRLSRPVQGDRVTTARMDSDWQAGLAALKRSRLSRFGSPFYVLPWYLALGPQSESTEKWLRHSAGTDSIHSRGEELPVLRWWLQRHCVVLCPTAIMYDRQATPGATNAYWRRLLYWMAHTRRREPLNGVILNFDIDWLTGSGDVELHSAGQTLRQQLDDLTRIYSARIPVYIVLTNSQALPGFSSWTHQLDDELIRQTMGYTSQASNIHIGQFISDAFNSIVHRMFDLRLVQGIAGAPDNEAFALPERIAPLAHRLDTVLRPAFQANPYAETPLLRGLYLTGQLAHGPQDEPVCFSEGLLNHTLPAQRDVWQPLERWRQWHRLLRHVAVLSWFLFCIAIGALLIHSSRVANAQLEVLNTPELAIGPRFSGGITSDLRAMQTLRDLVHTLQSPSQRMQDWLPFHRRVTQAQEILTQAYTREFHEEIIAADLNPLLASSTGKIDDRLLAAWAQTLVRRINLLDTALNDHDVYAKPAPGSEIAVLYANSNGLRPNTYDSILLGDMYQDYVAWQTDHQVLLSEREELRQVLMSLDLGGRPVGWIYEWVSLQGTIPSVRLTDFWNIPVRPDQPTILAAFTPAGVKAVAGFAEELADATRQPELWTQRHEEFRAQFMLAGINAWYEFADAFISAPNQLLESAARRGVLSTLFTTNDPYRRLLRQLAATGESLPVSSRPPWIQEAMRQDELQALVQNDAGAGQGVGANIKQHIDVVQQFGGELLQRLPGQDSVASGFHQLNTDQRGVTLLNTYRKNVLDTIVPLQQGRANAMKAAIDIWSFGHDPSLTSVPLIDANQALHDLRKQVGDAENPRTDIVWKLVAGPMEFTLDYAGRTVACTLQQNWDSTVLSLMQGVNDAELGNQLLFGDRGEIQAFLGGDAKNFIDQRGNRYVGRTALGREIPLNGLFYTFASLAQLRQVTLAGAALQSKRDQDEAQALNQQQSELAQKISKLEATTANVTLSTVPAQTNADARLLPESVTLTLQCANGRLTLENLNFPNQAVFPWSLANCGDTSLNIRFAGFILSRQWSGARGFVDFLREFASGERRYTPDEFIDQSAALQQAGVQWITVRYRQQGQDALLSAFAEAHRLTAQSDALKARLAQLQPGTAPGSTELPPQPAPQVPQRIISSCMGPADAPIAMAPTPPISSAKSIAKPITTHQPRPKQAPLPREATPHKYDVQVGIFSDPEKVREQLGRHGYRINEEIITLQGRPYLRIRVEGYDTQDAAKQAAADIGSLLKLTPEVLRRNVR